MARKSRPQASTGDGDVDLTPMLDVTFILLIFFIVTAQFIKDPGVTVERVDVRNDARVSPLGILIAIDSNSDIYMAKELIEPNQVSFFVREFREDNPKGEIVIQVDKAARAGVMEAVMTSVLDADPSARINISTELD